MDVRRIPGSGRADRRRTRRSLRHTAARADVPAAAVAGGGDSRCAGERSSSGRRRGPARWTVPTARASARSTCTGWVARRRTGPIWPPCWPSGSTAGRSTCPASAARSRRRAGGTRSAGTCGPSSTCSSTSSEQPGDGAGRPVHLVGNSLGGLVSVLVAGRRPDLVASLTLISPAMPVYRVPPAFSRALLLLLVPGIPSLAARRIGGITPEESVRAMVRMCFGQPSRVPPERLEQAVQEMRERAAQPWADRALTRSMRGLITSYLKVGATNAWRTARTLALPTLVHLGEQGPAGRPRPRAAARGRRPRLPPAGARGRRARGDARGARADRAGGARHGRGRRGRRRGRRRGTSAATCR